MSVVRNIRDPIQYVAVSVHWASSILYHSDPVEIDIPLMHWCGWWASKLTHNLLTTVCCFRRGCSLGIQVAYSLFAFIRTPSICSSPGIRVQSVLSLWFSYRKLDGPGHNVAIVGLLRSRVLWNDSHSFSIPVWPSPYLFRLTGSNMIGGIVNCQLWFNGPHTRGRSLIWMFVWCAAMS